MCSEYVLSQKLKIVKVGVNLHLGKKYVGVYVYVLIILMGRY